MTADGKATASPHDLIDRLAAVAPGFESSAAPEPAVLAARFRASGRVVNVRLDVADEACAPLQITIDAAGRGAAFRLRCEAAVVDRGRRSAAWGWAESEMQVFFAKHVFVSSRFTREEAASVHAIEDAARTLLVAACEEYRCSIALADETLSVDFDELAQFMFYARKKGAADVASHLVDFIANLARAVDGIPPGARAREALPEPVRCEYCSAFVFRTRDSSACVHCAAPLPASA